MTELPVWIDRSNIYTSSGGATSSGGETTSDETSSGGKTSLASSKLLRGIKGIIFDFDGTLFDNARFPFYLICANPLDIFRLWKERLVRKYFTGCDYGSPENYTHSFFTSLGKLCFRSPRRMQNWYFNRYLPRMARVLTKHYQFRSGVRELFRYFDSDSPDIPRVAIYSDYPMLKERIEAMGLYLSPHIPLYGPESFGAQKPAVRPFLRIADNLGVLPEEVLVIGDREDTDGLGAFKAGMRFFCLETGRRRYFRLDPDRRRPIQEPQGPTLVLYAGAWGDLVRLLLQN